jgi:hypothetical protein
MFERSPEDFLSVPPYYQHANTLLRDPVLSALWGVLSVSPDNPVPEDNASMVSLGAITSE